MGLRRFFHKKLSRCPKIRISSVFSLLFKYFFKYGEHAAKISLWLLSDWPLLKINSVSLKRSSWWKSWNPKFNVCCNFDPILLIFNVSCFHEFFDFFLSNWSCQQSNGAKPLHFHEFFKFFQISDDFDRIFTFVIVLIHLSFSCCQGPQMSSKLFQKSHIVAFLN